MQVVPYRVQTENQSATSENHKPESIAQAVFGTQDQNPGQMIHNWYGARPEKAWKPFPMPAKVRIKPATPQNLKFAGCMCAICMSIGLMVKERKKIEQLEGGVVDAPNVRQDGFMQAMKEKTGYTFIPHYAATRVYPMSAPDLKMLQNSFMEPTFDAGDPTRITELNLPKAEYEGKNVFVRVLDAFGEGSTAKIQEYPTVSKERQFVPLMLLEQSDLWKKMDFSKPQLFSIRHQVNKEDDPSPNTDSMGLGGMVVRQVLPKEQKELAMVRPFEFLGFHRAGQLPAGLVNLLLLTTDMDGVRLGNFEKMAVFVDREKQPQLYDYVMHLASLGLPIKEYVGGNTATGLPSIPVPDAYREEARRWYTGNEHNVSMFQIDLAKIRQWRIAGLSEAEQARLENHPLKTRMHVPGRERNGEPKSSLGEMEFFKILHEPAPIGKTLDDGMHSLLEHGVEGFRAVTDDVLHPHDHVCEIDLESPTDHDHDDHDHDH